MKPHYFDRRKERNQLLYDFWMKNKDLKLACKEFGIQVMAARTALKKMGVKFPRTVLHKNSACALNSELVFQLSDQGKSLAEIGRRVGTSGRHVHRFLKEHGKDRHFPTERSGADHAEWKGGRRTDPRGYIRIVSPNHPHASKYGRDVYEHRLVMEKHIGRYLLPGEVVHHRNGIPSDNRIENLELFSRNADHLAKELKGRCPNWTLDGIHRMQEAFARRTKNQRSRIHRDLKRDVSQLQ